jgi:probable rRNA maturation factor
MITLQVSDTLEQLHPISEPVADLVQKAAEYAFASASELAAADATVVLTDDGHITDLNLTYLGHNAPTDVLSFPSGEEDPETGIVYLGDIIISYPRACEQAASRGHAVEAELQLLVVHGMLHLCGYDHAEPGEKAAMWKIQSEILNRLECPISGPPPEPEP